MAVLRISAALLLVSACGFPRPADVGDPPGEPPDAAKDAIDAPEQPGTVVHVSNTGDDSNDGLIMPVKTLKHAIGIAAANSQITKIVLASGHYATATGETFPYTVPANVTIIGPAGGGGILTGSNTEPGMIVDAGTLQDLELEDFAVAITATGMARATNVHIRTNMLAVRAETTARLTVNNLDITGTVAACATGIELNGAAEFSATTLSTRNLGTALNAKDQSAVNIVGGSITGDRGCTQTVMMVTTNKPFMLSDSIFDGGADGLSFSPRSSTLQVTIVNTIMRNLKNDALGGGVQFGGLVTFNMSGGEVSNNGRGAVESFGGNWSFTNVTMTQNLVFGIYFQGLLPAPGTLTMRGCTVSGSPDAIYLFDEAAADLGTAVSPGNNTFQSALGVGLDIDGSTQPRIDAVGNTWRAVQGADPQGRYPSGIAPISGFVDRVAGNNYAIRSTSVSVQL
jgi:hypothetical protein